MTRSAKVDEGTLRLEGTKIWVLWDTGRKETWETFSPVEAERNFQSMLELWA